MTAHILLPLDPDEPSTWQKALPEAVAEARQRGATLHVMTVVPRFGSNIVASYFPEDFEKKAIAEAERQLKALVAKEVPNDLPHQIIVSHGRIHQDITNTAKAINADLIIMASHKPDWSDHFLAPNAAQVLQHTPISVFIVR